MLNYEEFVSKPHSLLIAPAGYGKTHTISECLKFTQGKQLILTHTHAGVASIKEKIIKASIPSSSYNVETITSFAQRYVLSFYTQNEIPKQEDSKVYYPFIIEKATRLFKIKPISKIISSTFNGLFVDEYQDCSLEQHKLILVLSELFPTRILGDYLQGIFGFNSESLVDLESPEDMGNFWTNRYILEVPWRWKIGGNELLGQELKIIRTTLENRDLIDLAQFSSLEVNVSTDIYGNDLGAIFKILNEEKNLLILIPNSSSIAPRIKFIQRFNNVCFLMESIDNESFYKLSKRCDDVNENNVFLIIREISLELFNKTIINQWFSESRVKNKRDVNEKILANVLEAKMAELKQAKSNSGIAQLLESIKNLPGVKCYRKELFVSLCRVLDESEANGESAYDAMLKKRNIIRRVGRKVYGRCIGTTLLTKGLEFDAVLIIEAHNFKCPKNLYVALTRASKRLIIFTNDKQLSPYT